MTAPGARDVREPARPAEAVLWDFDGTLAWRPGLWSGCLLEVLDEHEPGHGLGREQIRSAMRGRYPWNAPHDPHPQLAEPESWWGEMCARMAAALEDAGIPAERCGELAAAARRRFVDPAVGWRLFEDALPALRALAAAGARNAIVSNHVPELPQIVEALGLGGHVERVFTSAATGFEKPHPEAFRLALRELGDPRRVWMVGDNPAADVAGAAAVGIPAILIARGEEPAGRGPARAGGLLAAAARILASA